MYVRTQPHKKNSCTISFFLSLVMLLGRLTLPHTPHGKATSTFHFTQSKTSSLSFLPVAPWLEKCVPACWNCSNALAYYKYVLVYVESFFSFFLEIRNLFCADFNMAWNKAQRHFNKWSGFINFEICVTFVIFLWKMPPLESPFRSTTFYRKNKKVQFFQEQNLMSFKNFCISFYWRIEASSTKTKDKTYRDFASFVSFPKDVVNSVVNW